MMGDEGFEPSSFQNDAFQMISGIITAVINFIPIFRRRKR